MAKANRTGKRFGSMPETEVTGLSEQRGSMAASSSEDDFKLPTLGPVPRPAPVKDPLLEYTYRDNETFLESLDRIEVAQFHRVFNFNGYAQVLDNGSALIAGSALEDLNTRYVNVVYPWLHDMAQKRDGYDRLSSTLNDDLAVTYRDSLIVSLKVNIRVLWALYHATLVNEGLRSLWTGLRSFRSRIKRDLQWSNKIIYPQAWDAVIEYWSQVYWNYAGGTVTYNLFTLDPWLKIGAMWQVGTGTATIWPALPDLTSSSDVGALLNDIELALTVVTQYNINGANAESDMRNVNGIYNMMGFPTPQTPAKGLVEDPAKFQEQWRRYGFLFSDTKGAGADTHVYWPDIRGNIDTLIDTNTEGYPYDALDAIGAKGVYAYDADDDDTPGYTAEANDLTSYGMVHGTNWLTASVTATVPALKIFTPEDGWSTVARELDYTAAAGVQAHLWSVPDITAHPEGWRVIMSEEAEENYAYRLSMRNQGPKFQRPFDHYGQAYRKWWLDAYHIPYTT